MPGTDMPSCCSKCKGALENAELELGGPRISCQSDIMERFWDYGVDFSEENTLASYLAESTRNKPAYGFGKRHQSDPKIAYQLALALGDAV